MRHCRGCGHPTICDSHGCGRDEAQANKARREKAHADARQLQHCAIAVSDWLAGGCDVQDIPRTHIAALVEWTKVTTAEAAALGPNEKLSGGGAVRLNGS